MKFYIPVLMAALACMSASAADPTRYELDVKDFTELKVTDGINVDYRCVPDSAGKAVFVATPDMASALIFTPGNGKLSVQLASKEIDRSKLPHITVYSNFLTRVENDGDSTVRIISLVPGPKFKARLVGNGRLVVRDVKMSNVDVSIDTGNGSIVIYGEADNAKFTCTGSGHIQADDLKAENVKCNMWGTGSIGCAPVKTLNILGAGSGKVYYKGNPEIKNRSVGVKAFTLE